MTAVARIDDATKTGRAILAIIGARSMTARDLARESGLPCTACQSALNALVRKGKVRRYWHPSRCAIPLYRVP